MKLSSSGRATGIAGNGSSALSNSSSIDSSKPSKNSLNNKQPKKPISMRTRSSDRKRQRPHDQPPTDGSRSSDAVRPPHRHAIASATEALLGGGATASKKSLTFQSDPAATPPPLKILRQATSVSSDDRRNPHLREAPLPSPAASTPLPAAVALPTQGSAAKYLTASGGSCRGGRARKSKLSLNRRRPLRPPLPPHSSSSSSSSGVVGTDGSNLGSSWRPSSQQRHQSPGLSSAAALPHGEDTLAAGREDSVDTLAGGNLASTPPCSLPPPPLPPPLLLPPPPPPPFVGLENLGETCYVNAVVQALVACGEAVMPDGVTSSNNSGGREGSTRCRERVDGSDPPSSVPCVGGEGISVEAVAAAAGGGTTGGIDGGVENNSALEVLGNLLKEMKGRNGALSALASRGAPQQLVAPESLVTAPSLPEDVASQSEKLRTTGIEVGGETTAMSETRRLCEPSSRALDLPRNVGICETAINPVGLVNLICEGWLNAGRNTGGVKTGRGRHRGGLADPTASMGFGSGQQCASELLGKLLDLPVAAGVPADCGGEAATRSSRGQDVTGSTTSDLIEAFRGELCALTTCVECERDRATREEFTELTLPPLLSQEPPPSPNRAAETASAAAVAAAAVAANGRSLSKRPTLEGLVDTVLGSEILDGNSKVWCEACRLWTEAKRRFSIRSPPRLLALHVRPATGRQSVCPPPAAGEAAGMRGRGPCKAGERAVRGRKNGEGLIERVLIVKGAARRVFHDTMGPGAAESCRNRLSTTACTSGEVQKEVRGHEENRSLEKPGHSEDVRYELVGIILHKGQTLGSGHYTFALLTGASNRSVGQGPRQRPRHSSSALGVGAGDERCGPPPREMDARSTEPASASATEGVHGSAGKEGTGMGVDISAHGSAGEGVAGKGVSVSTSKEAFVLFDDACVRWLSPEEENEVLRGGAGGGGGLGDAFLVFYARRP